MNEFHGKVGLRAKARIRRTRLIDLRDAGMLQSSQRLGLLLESPQQLFAGTSGLNHLHCNCAPGMLLFRFIDDAHTAFAQNTNYLIVADAVICRQQNIMRRRIGKRFRAIGVHESEPKQAFPAWLAGRELSAAFRAAALGAHLEASSADRRKRISSSTSAGSATVSAIIRRSKIPYLFRARCTATRTAPSLELHWRAISAKDISFPVRRGFSFSNWSSLPSLAYSCRRAAMTSSSSATAHCRL